MNKEIKFIDSWDLCLELDLDRNTFNKRIRYAMRNNSKGICIQTEKANMKNNIYVDYKFNKQFLNEIIHYAHKNKQKLIEYRDWYYSGYKETYIENTNYDMEYKIELYEAGIENEEQEKRYVAYKSGDIKEYMDKAKYIYSEDPSEESYYRQLEENGIKTREEIFREIERNRNYSYVPDEEDDYEEEDY